VRREKERERAVESEQTSLLINRSLLTEKKIKTFFPLKNKQKNDNNKQGKKDPQPRDLLSMGRL